jgi:hypothetical protein
MGKAPVYPEMPAEYGGPGQSPASAHLRASRQKTFDTAARREGRVTGVGDAFRRAMQRRSSDRSSPPGGRRVGPPLMDTTLGHIAALMIFAVVLAVVGL